MPRVVSPGADCSKKIRFDSRMAADCAMIDAQRKWRRDKTRAAQPPVRVYQCERCDYGWHMTSKPE